MSLAKDQLEAGRSEAVLDNLTLCGKFWRRENGALNRWRARIVRGEIPDFGSNLRC